MFKILAKRISCYTILALSKAQHRSLRSRFFSASTTQNPDPKTPKFVVADYLISSFGFSPDKAMKVSKTISHVKSPENPDSVRRLLNDNGFSEADVKRLITWRPILLCCSPQNTLGPNLKNLRDMGLSTSALNKIILSNPNALLLQSAVPRIAFWMDFLNGNEAALVKAFTQNRALINHDITQAIAPKISLLQTHGFSNLELQRIVCRVPQFITSKISAMDDLLNRVKELGFQPGAGMFLQGLRAMNSVTRDTLKKKMELFKSFGWSEDDFFSASRNAPHIVTLKEENLRTKMAFFLGEARCAPSYIASHSILLTYSLEKRVRPRHHVLHSLETKGLCQKQGVLYTAICMSNINFVEKYILPHNEIIPELQEAFTVACASDSE